MVVIGGDNKKLFHLTVGEKKQIVIKTLGNNKMLFHLAVGSVEKGAGVVTS